VVFLERLIIAKYHTLCKEHEEKRSFGRPNCRCKQDIQVDYKETVSCGRDSSGFAYVKGTVFCTHGNEISGYIH